MIKLLSECTDKGTGLDGYVTHYVVGIGNDRAYSFQPRAINPQTKLLIDARGVPPERLVGGVECDDDKNLPVHVLGTEVTHTLSGITGMVIEIVMHATGCVHLIVQQKGQLPESGQTIKPFNDNILLFTSPLLKQLTEPEKKKEMKERPSPSEYAARERTW